DLAISRTDQNNVSGYGPIGVFRGIIDDIAGLTGDLEIEVKQIQAIDINMQAVPLRPILESIPLPETEEVVENPARIDLLRNLLVVPNPASGWIQVDLPYGAEVESLQVIGLNGQPYRVPVRGTDQLDLSTLPSGIYVLRIEAEGYILHTKVVKK
ncbi:MAG: T9SS type A sorting domain-containing protein, partial [Saprospiraceae bacterium]|nr:T9SS type A sorting domain-containing protein [Saprospiraceae bacterium]